MANVRPLHGASAPVPAVAPVEVQAAGRPATTRVVAKPRTSPPSPRPSPGETLDAGWDRKLARGVVAPDSIVDLHGLGLQAAYDLLDRQLGAAIARGDRVLLLVTGRPPRAGSERPHARGAIRAAVGDWIAASRHAGAIAAIRAAHPRHGGAGALYLILRRGGRRPSSNS
ncbi:Smr/MutS family protein [Hephaestia caeni]|nr:Smr/MutS family protein [Hephaestia caeni]